MKIKAKYIIIYCATCIILFLLFVKVFLFNEEDLPMVNKETEIEVLVEEIEINRGVTTINNEFVIFLASMLDSEKKPYWLESRIKSIRKPKNTENLFYLSDITPPYHLLKKKNENILTVIKNRDTLRFELIDPNASDPDDPTIKEFFESLLERGDK